jgi:hypothetical protein
VARAVGLSVIQSSALFLCVVAVLVLTPDRADLGVAAAGILGAAFTDLAFESARLLASVTARRALAWDQLRRRTLATGAGAALLVLIVALCPLLLGPPEWWAAAAVCGTMVVVGATSVVSTLLRTGAAAAAAAVSVAVAVTCGAVAFRAEQGFDPTGALAGLGIVMSLLSLGVAAESTARPASWTG